VHLRADSQLKGLLVPASALIYSEKGAYVYRQETGAANTFRYSALPVKPLARIGNAWLVDGVGRADPVVTQGAAVLWSLQGISSFSAAEEDHD
jgi:multidrug efflux pump subunit AcrA (membrane-fusion protein)